MDDMSCQSKLKEQSELVIVVPCQEGEEKSFIQRDEFLKSFALGSKGEISRNVLSPMRAKGLEFARVVLYKFGDEAVREGHVHLMLNLCKSNEPKREETLGLEYFFNSVYVGASRAQKRLFIVDTRDGIDKFWRFATDSAAIDKLLTPRRQQVWSQSDLHHVMRGTMDSWQADRDDPRALAERFFVQGSQEKSTHLLQLAKNQYEALGDLEKKELCTALIADTEQRHSEAGPAYYNVGKYEDAIRCYWEISEYKKVTEIANEDIGRYGVSPYVIAASYQAGEKNRNQAVEFLNKLGQRIANLGQAISFAEPTWTDVITGAVDVIGKSLSDDLADAGVFLGEVHKTVEKLRDLFGLELNASKELAKLAYCAGDHGAALSIWGTLEKKNRVEPRFVVHARATTSAYPENLKWYDRLDDQVSILEEYRQHGDVNLGRNEHDIVLRAMLANCEYAAGANFVIQAGDVTLARMYLCSLPRDEKLALGVLPGYVCAAVESAQFRQLIDEIVKPADQGIPVLEALLSQDALRLRVVSALIKLLARSTKFVDDKANNKYVIGHLERLVTKDLQDLLPFVSLEEIGATLERSGRIELAVPFYESVFKNHARTEDARLQEHAKRRYLKCLERAATESPKQREMLLRQVKEKESLLGVTIPGEEFPILPLIDQHEIEELLALSSSVPATEQLKSEKPVELSNGTTSETQHPTSQELPTQQVSHLTGQEISGCSPEIPLRDKVPFEGKIAFELQPREDVVLSVKVLQSKRRIVMTNSKNEDELRVHAQGHEIESRDISYEQIGESQWRIPDWRIVFSLLKVSEQITLADVCSLDDKRILCIAI